MLTSATSRAARGLLDWTQDQLAKAAGVGITTVRTFEKGVSVPVPQNLSAMRRALEAAGVEFAPENSGGEGVRKKEGKQSLSNTSDEAEHALLGALMANKSSFERISGSLLAEYFSDPIHGHIFEAISRRIAAGQPANAAALRRYFEQSNTLDEVGGVAYLGQLQAIAVGPSEITGHARIILASWALRRLASIGEETSSLGREKVSDALGRSIDITKGAAEQLDCTTKGVRVILSKIQMLLASLEASALGGA